jgi:hypothetical protein
VSETIALWVLGIGVFGFACSAVQALCDWRYDRRMAREIEQRDVGRR